MDVTEQNFAKLLPVILENVRNASFAAVDMEFLGFETDDPSIKPSLFDRPSERYHKYVLSVQKFPPVQWGLALFTAVDNGLHYRVDVYNIYLFKRLYNRKVYSYSLPSVAFLAEHNLDFNKVIKDGVTYANLDEIAKIRAQLEEGLSNYEIFGNRFNGHLNALKFHLTSMLDRLRKARSPPSSVSEEVMFTPIRVDFEDSLYDPCGPRLDILPPKRGFHANRLQEAVRLYSLHCNLRHIKMKVFGSELKVQHSKMSEKAKKYERTCLLNRTINEIAGASQILYAIIDAHLPVVGHNCLFDLLYLYQYFFADLPDEYETWKKTLNTILPIIVDTKILAEENKKRLSFHGVVNFSLTTLGSYFKHPDIKELISCNVPTFSSWNDKTERSPDGSQSYHNAAFDAKTTGETFVLLSQMIFGDRTPARYKDAEKPGPIHVLLYAIRPLANRIPVPRMGAPFLNLIGDDPASTRPQYITLQSSGVTNFSFTQPLSTPISEVDLKRELDALFGHWRYEIKLIENEQKALIATNTEHTYKCIQSYFSTHVSYKIASDNENNVSERCFSKCGRICQFFRHPFPVKIANFASSVCKGSIYVYLCLLTTYYIMRVISVVK